MVESTGTPEPRATIESPPPTAAVLSAPKEEDVRVSGTVWKDAKTKEPYADVCVIVGPATIRCMTTTDEKGEFFVDLPREFAVSWTIRFLVDGKDKASKALIGPFKEERLELDPVVVQP